MPNYKLTYFDGMGRAEPIRLLFHLLEQPFEDIRFTYEEWPDIKKDMPWGKAPILEIDGKVVCQSTAICRYLARMAGLDGSDPWENLCIDEAVGCADDLTQEMVIAWIEEDEELKEKKNKKYLKEIVPFYLERFDKKIQENSGHLVNGKLTWADLVLISYCWMNTMYAGYDIAENFPHIKALQGKIENHPLLKEYIQNRPPSDF